MASSKSLSSKSSHWTTGLNKETNFRSLLLAFIQRAFPDRSVLHPWMPDFKSHMFNWGYRWPSILIYLYIYIDINMHSYTYIYIYICM